MEPPNDLFGAAKRSGWSRQTLDIGRPYGLKIKTKIILKIKKLTTKLKIDYE